MQLRACVRNSLGIKAENKEIDAWFTKVGRASRDP